MADILTTLTKPLVSAAKGCCFPDLFQIQAFKTRLHDKVVSFEVRRTRVSVGSNDLWNVRLMRTWWFLYYDSFLTKIQSSWYHHGRSSLGVSASLDVLAVFCYFLQIHEQEPVEKSIHKHTCHLEVLVQSILFPLIKELSISCVAGW
jgi:hypothetical protein